MRYSEVRAKNRVSPPNEDAYIEAYKKAIPSAANYDSYDIAAVVTISGIYGHAMMHYSDNRSHDDDYQTGQMADCRMMRYATICSVFLCNYYAS